MKTELMLLLQTDGKPTMTLSQVSSLLSITPRSLQSRIYKRAIPFAMFKLADTGDWVAHVSDVAKHIDEQRDAAHKEMVALGFALPE
jgi:Pyocin activator protein PrtN